jgi:hypothetical protein
MTKEKIGKFTVKQVGAESDRVLRFIGTDESEDRDGDIIKANGWKFENFFKNPVFLPFHDYSKVPIGKCINVQQSPGSTGTSFDIKFPSISELCSDPEHPSQEAKLADTIYMAYKHGYMNAVSVGFIGLESVKREDQKELPDWMRGNIFTSQELLELSAVSVPSNPNALLQARSAKGMKPDQLKMLEEILKEKPNQEAEEMTPDQVEKSIAEAIKPLQEEIKALKEEKQLHAQEKAGAKISADTKKQMQECYDHVSKGIGVLKGLMDGSGEEPEGQVSDKPGTEQSPNVPAPEKTYKGIDLNKIDFKKYESASASKAE